MRTRKLSIANSIYNIGIIANNVSNIPIAKPYNTTYTKNGNRRTNKRKYPSSTKKNIMNAKKVYSDYFYDFGDVNNIKIENIFYNIEYLFHNLDVLQRINEHINEHTETNNYYNYSENKKRKIRRCAERINMYIDFFVRNEIETLSKNIINKIKLFERMHIIFKRKIKMNGTIIKYGNLKKQLKKDINELKTKIYQLQEFGLVYLIPDTFNNFKELRIEIKIIKGIMTNNVTWNNNNN